MKTPSRSSSRRRRIARPLGLIAAVGIIATLAQVAGVGGLSGHHKTVNGTSIATVAGSPVPDITSTQLASAKIKVPAGTTIRFEGRAHIVTDKLHGSAKRGQGVCGVTLSRDGDPSWSIGTPYETTTLALKKTTNSTLDRSFTAPATDTYRLVERCHIATPGSGAKARGTGAISVHTGLPSGAAKPRAKH